MLEEGLVKLLSKVYAYKNKDKYDFEKKVSVYKKPENLTEKEKLLLEDSHFQLNKIEFYNHDISISDLKEIITTKDLEKKVYALFFNAVGKGFHRGLQPIISYSFAKNIPIHKYIPIEENGLSYGENERPCKICGLPKSKWENSSKNLYDLYIGYCRIGAYFEMLMDLKEIQHSPLEKIEAGDINAFNKLIDLIKRSRAEETPTGLINEISKAKLLPKSNHTTRTWFVRILAELGILNNKLVDNYSVLNSIIPYDEKLKLELKLHSEAPNERTEVNFPISAWRGRLGVNEKIINQIMTDINNYG